MYAADCGKRSMSKMLLTPHFGGLQARYLYARLMAASLEMAPVVQSQQACRNCTLSSKILRLHWAVFECNSASMSHAIIYVMDSDSVVGPQ